MVRFDVRNITNGIPRLQIAITNNGIAHEDEKNVRIENHRVNIHATL